MQRYKPGRWVAACVVLLTAVVLGLVVGGAETAFNDDISWTIGAVTAAVR